MSSTIEEIVARGTILSSDGTEFTEEEFRKNILGNGYIDILVPTTKPEESATRALFFPWIKPEPDNWKNTIEDNKTIRQKCKGEKRISRIGVIERRYYERKCLYYVFGRYRKRGTVCYIFYGLFKFNINLGPNDCPDIYHEKVSDVLNIPIFNP